MDSLFPPTVEHADIPAISGLRYLADYITVGEEERLLHWIDRGVWNTEWKRRRQSYGGDYGGAGAASPIPRWGLDVADRMFAEGITDHPFDHMLVNEYVPGQGIAFHRDYAPYGHTVVSLSLLSPCVMDFRSSDDEREAALLLERRSLLVLRDDARYRWQHGIAARKRDLWKGFPVSRSRRLSITFRFLKARPNGHTA